MRTIHRLVAALAAVLLAAGLVSAAPAVAAEKEKREITIEGKEVKPNKFVIKGKISPSTGKPVNAIVQHKKCKKNVDCKAAWRTFEKIKTNDRGRYTQRVSGPSKGFARVYYRVVTEPNDKFLGAKSLEVFIYRIG